MQAARRSLTACRELFSRVCSQCRVLQKPWEGDEIPKSSARAAEETQEEVPLKLSKVKTQAWVWEELIIAKLRIRKWVQNFLWDPRLGPSSRSVDSVPANTSPFHLSAFCFLLEPGIPGSGREQCCLLCRAGTPAPLSACWDPHCDAAAWETLGAGPATWVVAECERTSSPLISSLYPARSQFSVLGHFLSSPLA